MNRMIRTRGARRMSRRRMLGLTGTLGIGAVGIALVGCGGDDDDDDNDDALAPAEEQAPAEEPPPAPTAEGVVNVSITEFAITLDATSAPAGSVTFNITNNHLRTRALTHEFVVIRTDLAVDALPTGGGQVDESALEVLGRTGRLEEGASELLTLELTPGAYLLICNILAHYGRGQRAAFTVV